MRRATFKIRSLLIILAVLASTDVAASNQIISSNMTWHAGEVHDLTDSTVQIAKGGANN